MPDQPANSTQNALAVRENQLIEGGPIATPRAYYQLEIDQHAAIMETGMEASGASSQV
jgi:hypothetical protein